MSLNILNSMNSQLVYPKDWIKLALDETANYFVDGDWIEAEFIGKEGTRIIQTGNIGIGSYLDKKENAKYIDVISFKKLNCKKVFPGDLLICRLADPIGRCCLVPDFQDYYVTAVDVAIYRPKKNTNKVFMMYLLNSKEKLKEMADKAGGSTRQRISRLNLGKISLTIPKDVKEQEKIAEILSITDDAIAKTEQLITKYKSIKQGLMQDLFRYGIDEKGQIRSEKTHKFKDSPLGRIPKEWDVTGFESVCTPGGMVRGPFGGALKKEIFVKEGYKVYEQGNAIYQNHSLGEYFVTERKYKEMKRFSISVDDFIISCSGTIGCIYRIPSDAPNGIINQALLKITLNNKLNKDFFSYYFDAEFRSRIIDSTQGGVINNLVGMDQIRKAQLKLIPLPEQHRLASTLNSISHSIKIETDYKSKLFSIKQGLMQDLLTGKVRVTHLLN